MTWEVKVIPAKNGFIVQHATTDEITTFVEKTRSATIDRLKTIVKNNRANATEEEEAPAPEYQDEVEPA